MSRSIFFENYIISTHSRVSLRFRYNDEGEEEFTREEDDGL